MKRLSPMRYCLLCTTSLLKAGESQVLRPSLWYVCLPSGGIGSSRLSRDDEPELQLMVSLELVVELSESLSPSEQQGCSRLPGASGAEEEEESGVVGGCCGEEEDEGVSG